MIKVATLDDLELVVAMSMKFAKASPYSNYVTEDKVRELVLQILEADNSKMICLLSDDKGMIIGTVNPFYFGNTKVASELAWWVEPEYRKAAVGKELMDAFEYWAQTTDCELVTVSCLDDQLGKYYEKRGFKLQERSYMKELRDARAN